MQIIGDSVRVVTLASVAVAAIMEGKRDWRFSTRGAGMKPAPTTWYEIEPEFVAAEPTIEAAL